MSKTAKVVKFERDELTQIVKLSKRQRVSANEWIRRACRDALEKQSKGREVQE